MQKPACEGFDDHRLVAGIGWGTCALAQQDDAEEEASKGRRTGMCRRRCARGTAAESENGAVGKVDAERDAWPGAAGSEEKASVEGTPTRHPAKGTPSSRSNRQSRCCLNRQRKKARPR
jgi:hypothetical protein